ncbi:MAG: hypothetical protein IIA02_06930 [Proteobacteria bacterium]|uniref:hypothetical protein n=1 Tax=Aquabacterium sp. TaxID=1872578 RepID=UPI0035C739AA|nr:hypothetical protein [Pseudomonadota bacterium]
MSGLVTTTATSPAAQRRARQRWLVLGLGATLAAAYFAPPPDDGGVVPSQRTQRGPTASSSTPTSVMASGAASAPAVPAAAGTSAATTAFHTTVQTAVQTAAGTVLAIQPREAFSGDDALFRGQAVAMAAPQARPQPPAVLASAPAEEPVPRLSLKLIGRYVDNGATAAFVQLQDQNLVVRVGELLGAQHRVEQIDEVSLTVRHLPSGQLQTHRLDGAP